MNGGSLRLRLMLAGIVSILAALALSAAGLVLLFERHVERRVEAELGVYLDQVVAGLDRSAEGALAVTRPPGDPRFEAPLSGLYWQVLIEGSVVGSRSLWDARLDLPPDMLADGAVHRHRVAGPGGTELVVVERSIRLPRRLGGLSVRAAVALDRAEIVAATYAFAVDLLPYMAILGSFLIAAAYAQVAIGLRPLAAVRSRLAAIRSGRRDRLGQAFPDEIQPLAAEFDALLDERALQLERARTRAADLAHGLKTPLQVLAGDVERLRAKGEMESAGDIEQVASAMRRHVERELARARTAAAKPDAHASAAEVVERVLAVVTRTPAGAALRWSSEVPAEAVVRIDQDDLAEALGNLLENAARHARAAVSVDVFKDGSNIVVSISDDGPGVPAEQLEQVLRRGGRLDRTGGGAGLGLAIVHEIAEAWGGRLDVRNGREGLIAELRLPAG